MYFLRPVLETLISRQGRIFLIYLYRVQTNRTEECSYWQFLFTVDISVHHVVDVGSKLNPRALKWDNTRRVELRTIRVERLPKEHPW